MSLFSDTVVPIAKSSMWFADSVTASIPTDTFARMPDGIKTNSPAWVIGHLGVYPGWVLSMLAGTEAVNSSDDDMAGELFGHSSQCMDDVDGTKYPGKDKLLTTFNTGMQQIIEALPGASESALNAPNPSEQMRERFPTVASLTAFMVGSHCMMHLGQVSTWRRCMGLGPCM